MSSKIYVVGETLIDLVHQEATPEGQTKKFLGGSPANIAVTLGRLGENVELISAFNSSDALGEFALQEMAKSNVKPSATSGNAPQTWTARAEVDAAGHATYEFDYSEEIDLQPLDAYPEMASLHAGSLSTHQPNFGPKILELFQSARAAGVKTFYDPNIRPTIIPERDFVRDLTEKFIATSDVAKVSDEDLEWLYPGVDPLESASHWRGLGAKLVVVTQGGDGATALFFEAETGFPSSVHVDTPKVEVADTVGAGDSFMGALISKLTPVDIDALDEPTVRAALDFAARVAGITVSRPGANPPFLAEL